MFRDLHSRAQRAGQPPGLIHNPPLQKKASTLIKVVHYTLKDYHVWEGDQLEQCPLLKSCEGVTWVNVQGLTTEIIGILAQHYHLHPLTAEDISNMTQRPKMEEFEKYEFIILKIINNTTKSSLFSVDQICLVLGDHFVLSFTSEPTSLFDGIYERLQSDPNQRLRQHGGDYLMYRILDTVIDHYFVTLETIGTLIDKAEEEIIHNPQAQSTRSIYRLKKKILLLRKAIWPAREVISHLQQIGEKHITPFTRLYLRDLYDHIVLAVDTIEVFRDMLSNLLDIYLSSLTNRMNEVMKTLTIIATIFIPTTFICSIYGMNFTNMPELHYRWGYPTVLAVMAFIAVGMLFYFHRKKWI